MAIPRLHYMQRGKNSSLDQPSGLSKIVERVTNMDIQQQCEDRFTLCI